MLTHLIASLLRRHVFTLSKLRSMFKYIEFLMQLSTAVNRNRY